MNKWDQRPSWCGQNLTGAAGGEDLPSAWSLPAGRANTRGYNFTSLPRLKPGKCCPTLLRELKFNPSLRRGVVVLTLPQTLPTIQGHCEPQRDGWELTPRNLGDTRQLGGTLASPTLGLGGLPLECQDTHGLEIYDPFLSTYDY